MPDVFLLTLRQMFVFLALFAVGILLSRRQIVPRDAGTTLSRLITWVFLPALCFDSFACQFTRERIGSYAVLLVAGVAVVLLSIPVSLWMRKLLPGPWHEKIAAAYSMVVPNFAYFGYPLVLALFGQEILTSFMMFALPINFYVYGYALPQWMPEEQRKGGFLRRTLSAPLVALLLGLAFGLSGLPYPKLVSDLLTPAAGCLGPCAMLVAGVAMGHVRLTRAFTEKRAYLVSAVRLIALPLLFIAAAFGLSLWLHWDSTLLLVAGAYVSLPLGLNPVVFAETYGQDGSFGAECALVSMLMSLITLPLAMSLLLRLSQLL